MLCKCMQQLQCSPVTLTTREPVLVGEVVRNCELELTLATHANTAVSSSSLRPDTVREDRKVLGTDDTSTAEIVNLPPFVTGNADLVQDTSTTTGVLTALAMVISQTRSLVVPA